MEMGVQDELWRLGHLWKFSNLGIGVPSLVEMVLRTTSLLKTLLSLSRKRPDKLSITSWRYIQIKPGSAQLLSLTLEGDCKITNWRILSSFTKRASQSLCFSESIRFFFDSACMFVLKGYFVTGRWNSGDPHNARDTSRIKSTRRGFWAIPEKALALLSLSV